MKRFVLGALAVAAGFAGIGFVFIVMSFVLGMNAKTAADTIYQFGYGRGNIVDYVFSPNQKEGGQEEETTFVLQEDEYYDYYDSCKKLEIEVADGSLMIETDDIPKIEVAHFDTRRFESKLDGDTLHIEIGKNSGDGVVEIRLPNELDLEKVDVEIGAGTADISLREADKIDIEVGAGELTMRLLGREEDYNYNIQCGIGEVFVGDGTYSGFGYSKKIENGDASNKMKIECGIGTVGVYFSEEI